MEGVKICDVSSYLCMTKSKYSNYLGEKSTLYVLSDLGDHEGILTASQIMNSLMICVVLKGMIRREENYPQCPRPEVQGKNFLESHLCSQISWVTLFKRVNKQMVAVNHFQVI